ncbi:YlxR family protein [Nocardioides sp. KR10-350]|uniref:YlxR family protein n=1 Tax=Nocardioides cheoyonin TaxID=3156615 RepID=UPI0032B3BE71
MARQDISPTARPVRTCVGCRKRAAKRELLRVTAGSDHEGNPAVVPDPTATAPGRGAHLHPTRECYDLAVRRKAFTRALRLEGGLSSAPVGDYLDERRTPTAPAVTRQRPSPTVD